MACILSDALKIVLGGFSFVEIYSYEDRSFILISNYSKINKELLRRDLMLNLLSSSILHLS